MVEIERRKQPDVIAEKADETIQAAKDLATKAVETAVSVAERNRNSDERMTGFLSEALREVFGENQKTQRFVDVSRIPLICQNINEMHENIKEIKDIIKENDAKHVNHDQFWPIKTLVYSGVGVVLLAVLGAVITLVLKK